MKPIYILGSGGFAKEVYALIKSTGEYHLEAFIDLENKENMKLKEREIPVISEKEFLSRENAAGSALAIGIGDPAVVKKITDRFAAFDFPNLIHPGAIYDRDEVTFGKGNIITAGVIFTTCIQTGDFNIFNLSATIGHDCGIGHCNVINPTVNISGGVTIGNCNLLGVGSTILQYKKIGNYTTVGACSLVTKDVCDGITVIGVPARPFTKE